MVPFKKKRMAIDPVLVPVIKVPYDIMSIVVEIIVIK